MESESVLIVAALFIFINAGVIICSETFRDSTSNNSTRDLFARIICPACVAVSVIAMFGAQQRKPMLLVPFLLTLAIMMISLVCLAIYVVALCPFQSDPNHLICSIGIVLGATCIGGLLFGTCLTYIVYSLYKFFRYGLPDDERENHITDIELLDRDNENAQPSTSYN